MIAPMLIGYAVLVAFLLIQFNFQMYFWWYFGLAGLSLLNNHIKQYKSESYLDKLCGDNEEMRAMAKTSMKNTIRYQLLSSMVFATSLILAFFSFSR
jgi:3-mercaptopyruvate sulfurtransferase SseA